MLMAWLGELCRLCPALKKERVMGWPWACHGYLSIRKLPQVSLLNFTLLYSTLLCSTLLYSTLLYSALLYSILLYSTLLYSILFYSGRITRTICILWAMHDVLQHCGSKPKDYIPLTTHPSPTKVHINICGITFKHYEELTSHVVYDITDTKGS